MNIQGQFLVSGCSGRAVSRILPFGSAGLFDFGRSTDGFSPFSGKTGCVGHWLWQTSRAFNAVQVVHRIDFPAICKMPIVLNSGLPLCFNWLGFRAPSATAHQ